MISSERERETVITFLTALYFIYGFGTLMLCVVSGRRLGFKGTIYGSPECLWGKFHAKSLQYKSKLNYCSCLI